MRTETDADFSGEAVRELPKANRWLAVPAHLISYVFHPLFVPTYFFLFLQRFYRIEFAGITDWHMQLRLFNVFWITAFFPAFGVFLLWKLKFSNGIFLRTQQERVGPYFISMFFYWWMYYLSRTFADQPYVLKIFYFGTFSASIIGLIFNNYIKISLHGIAMGGAAAAVAITTFFYATPSGLSMAVAVVLLGIVATSRLIVSDHTFKEVYAGIIVGVLSQGIGYWFV